jgi:O-antigen biosynthesis protein
VPVLVIIGYVWPEPKSSAAGYRMLSIIELFIAQGWQVIFACAAEKTVHRADLAKLGVQEQQILLNDDSFDHWLSTLAVQAVMFDRFMLEEQFGWRVEKSCPDALRILDMEDMHSLRHARHQAHKEGRGLQTTDLNSELAVREIAAIYRCDITLVISQYEMQLLQQHYAVPVALLCYCPFLVDTAIPISQRDYKQRQHFVAIGNFRHAPNWQAVLWLKQTIWPLIRQQLPQSQLYIYGAYPPPKATALHNPKQGFYVKGWAEDVAEVMQQARVCLAPLAFGAGLKGKLLDAMQFGTPSVTTDIGAEGMTLAGEAWSGIIANTSADVASAAVQLYQDPNLWLAAQQQGARILKQQFSAAKWQPVIWQQLQQTLTNLQQHRTHNFTGIMLQHHAYRSTKFMGQWIEAKNRLAAE